MIIHGKAVCDSGARSCRRLNEQQAALLDQWCIAGIKASETPTHTEKTEGLVESKSVLEIRKVVVEQRCAMEDKEKIHSEEDCPQASQDCTNGNKFFEPTADGAEESENDGFEVPEQFTSGLSISENVDGTGGSEAQVINESLVYDLSALLTDSHAQSVTNHTWLQPAPTGWYFPVGIGLSEVGHHPLQFPGTSYYHGFQENTNSEGTFSPQKLLHFIMSCLCYVHQKDSISVFYILSRLSNLLLDFFSVF